MGWFFENNKWVCKKGKDMEKIDEFINWWKGWYKQETNLVMPKIAEKKMKEQLQMLSKKLPISKVVGSEAELRNTTLKQAIDKAKPNLDKITDVDKHLDSIR